MKLFASLLFVAACAVATPVFAQVDHTAEDSNAISGIRRPTPAPSSSSSTVSAKPTGPLTAVLAKDSKGKSETSTFTPADNVYLVCANVPAKKGDKVGAAWYGGKKERKVYGTENVVPGDGAVTESFNLAPPKGGSPAGTYRAELLVNGKVLKNLKFTVQ